MNVPGIRAALRRMNHIHECDGEHAYQPSAIRCEVIQAVVRIGQRACDEWAGCCSKLRRLRAMGYHCPACDDVEQRLAVIADILREAGVEVEG